MVSDGGRKKRNIFKIKFRNVYKTLYVLVEILL